MFETKKTLLVVYKDEMLVNQLKKMVETHDDEQSVDGTKDGSINIVAWTEKVWLENKKAGNIQGKILFLGDIKGTDKLIPVIDVKFNEYGVRFGWAGNQAIVYSEPKVLNTREDYDAFLKKLSELPVPDVLKATQESNTAANIDQESENTAEQSTEDTSRDSGSDTDKPDDEKEARFEPLEGFRKTFSRGRDVFGKVSTQVALKSEKIFRSRSLKRQQMLFYGVVRFYNDGLEEFMNV